MDTKAIQQLRDKIELAARTVLIIQLHGEDMYNSPHRGLFHLLELRKLLAMNIVSGNLNSTEDAYKLFESYNEKIKEVTGL